MAENSVLKSVRNFLHTPVSTYECSCCVTALCKWWHTAFMSVPFQYCEREHTENSSRTEWKEKTNTEHCPYLMCAVFGVFSSY